MKTATRAFSSICVVFIKNNKSERYFLAEQNGVQWEIQLYHVGAFGWYINNAAWPHTATAFNSRSVCNFRKSYLSEKTAGKKNICNRCTLVTAPSSAGSSPGSWPLSHPKASVCTISSLTAAYWGWKTLGVSSLFVCFIQGSISVWLFLGSSAVKTLCNSEIPC